MNLQQVIISAIESDTDFTSRQQARLIKKYESLEQNEKDIVDDIFISLTGYGLETLIADISEEEDDEDEETEEELDF
jgi:hypothetical protein